MAHLGAFDRHEDGSVTLDNRWLVGTSKNMPMGNAVASDFVSCLRRDLGFCTGVKSLATCINRGRAAISYRDAVVLIGTHLVQSRAMITACVRLLLQLSIQHGGYISTAIWASMADDDSWRNFLLFCNR